MKKLSSLLLLATVSLSLGLMTGCTGDGKVHVKFWHTMGQSNQALLDRMITDFNEIYPDVVIDHSAQGDYAALHTKLLSAIPAGTMPNMAFCYPDHVADYLDINAVVNVEDYLNDENLGYSSEDGALNDYISSYWEEGQSYLTDGTYSVPFAKSTEVLFYNKDFFDENSSLISVPTTWEEMWNTCQIIKEQIMTQAKYSTMLYPMAYDSDSNLFITMCEQRGIDYTTNDATGSGHIVFNNDQAKSLISELVGYYDDGYFATKGVIPNSAYSSTYFTEGKIVMSIGSTGGTSYQTSSNFDVGVVPCPVTSSEGNGNKYISQGPSICFFKKGTTAQKEAAWNFYKFITRSLNTAAYGVLTGYEPVRTSAYELPSYQSYLSTDVLQAKVSACTSTLEGRYFNSPVFYGSATARDVVGEIFANVALGTKTLDGAFADAYVTATAACKTGE